MKRISPNLVVIVSLIFYVIECLYHEILGDKVLFCINNRWLRAFKKSLISPLVVLAIFLTFRRPHGQDDDVKVLTRQPEM